MGFLDGLTALFDTRRWYTEGRLYQYFEYEIYGSANPEGFKEEVTTNLRKLINDYIKEYYPEANVYRSGIENVPNFTGSLEKVDDSIYKIVYIGKIKVRDVYDDFIGYLYYRVVVYTDKYAVLSKNPNHRTCVTVSKNSLA